MVNLKSKMNTNKIIIIIIIIIIIYYAAYYQGHGLMEDYIRFINSSFHFYVLCLIADINFQ